MAANASDLRRSPPRLLLLACAAAGVVNALLLTGAGGRLAARAGLEATAANLRENLATLAALRADRERLLEGARIEAQDRIDIAEAAMPPPVARLDIFRLGYELARDTGAVVVSVRRASTETRETPLGSIEITDHTISAFASLDQCLDYMDALESIGPGVGLAGVAIQPAEGGCAFSVRTLVRP